MNHLDQPADVTVGAVIRAWKELECMNEAICEIRNSKTSKERAELLHEELACRVWAAYYALQYMSHPERRPDSYEEVMKSADAFDCTGTLEEYAASGLFDGDEIGVH